MRKILLLIQRKGALGEFLFIFHKTWFKNIYYEYKVALDRIFGVVKRRKYHCWYFRHFFIAFYPIHLSNYTILNCFTISLTYIRRRTRYHRVFVYLQSVKNLHNAFFQHIIFYNYGIARWLVMLAEIM